jgi:hypothetical protein
VDREALGEPTATLQPRRYWLAVAVAALVVILETVALLERE